MSTALQWYFGPFRLDSNTGSLWRDDELVALPPKPLALLTCLVSQAGEVVTKEGLLDAVWSETAVSEGVLKTHMRQIRQVLGESAREPQFIETVSRRGYRFIAPVTTTSPLEMPEVRPQPGPAEEATPLNLPAAEPALCLVGRDAELAQLRMHFAQAGQGDRQVVSITGEAGIGKTTLVDAFVAQVMSTTEVWIGRGQCVEQYGAGEPYLPLLEALGRLGRGPQGTHLVEVLRQQAPSWLLHLPALVTPEESAALQMRVGGATRERMLRELAEAVETLTAMSPVILVLEDLQWSDVSTVEWLAYVARRRDPARLLVLGTYRSVEAIMRNHPVRTVTQELLQQGQGGHLALEYLTEASVTAYLSQRFGSTADLASWSPLLHQRTNGNPLFLVTIVEELIRQDALIQDGQSWSLQRDLAPIVGEIPQSIQHLIERQLVTLSMEERELLERASAAGAEFSAAVLTEDVGHADALLDGLVRRGQFVQAHGVSSWPDGTVAGHYGFIHTLYQETLYNAIPVSRRVELHRQIGRRLESAYGPETRHIAAELADHFVRGRDTLKAVVYLQYAGENALRRSAHQEAFTHLTQGLRMLSSLPTASEHAQQEITLNLNLAIALVAIKGQASSEVESVYARTQALCQQIGETSQLIPTLLGLSRCYTARAEFERARDLGEHIMHLAHTQSDTALRVEAHRNLGGISFLLGMLTASHMHLEKGIELYDPQQHHSHTFRYQHDPGVVCRSILILTLWVLGYPDQALARNQEQLTLAQALPDPHTLAFAIAMAAIVHQFRREAPLIQKRAEAVVTLSANQGFAPLYNAIGVILLGWQRGIKGAEEVGIAQMRQGLADYRSTEAGYLCPYFLCLLAEIYERAGQPAAGLEVLAEAGELVDKTGERFYEAELHRLKGELLRSLSRNNDAQAETYFNQALDIARCQQAKSLELRAAMSLGRLWLQQGKRDEVRQLIAPIYGWFTEGFDTVDMKDAKAMLDSIAGI